MPRARHFLGFLGSPGQYSPQPVSTWQWTIAGRQTVYILLACGKDGGLSQHVTCRHRGEWSRVNTVNKEGGRLKFQWRVYISWWFDPILNRNKMVHNITLLNMVILTVLMFIWQKKHQLKRLHVSLAWYPSKQSSIYLQTSSFKYSLECHGLCQELFFLDPKAETESSFCEFII